MAAGAFSFSNQTQLPSTTGDRRAVPFSQWIISTGHFPTFTINNGTGVGAVMGVGDELACEGSLP